MNPLDIARATGHNLDSVDDYLGTYKRGKVLLRKGFDLETICQVTGKAPRTVAEYLVIVEHYQPELMGKDHRGWLIKRRKKVGTMRFLPAESMTPMVTALEEGGAQVSGHGEIVAPGGSGEVDSKDHPASRGLSRLKKTRKQSSKK
jgi:hypothetical protein